ncbi:OmpA family protein [Rapidithrix thailandica]|uniref:OmpA family protein n=1 Tax=Rapidithrix thailandica TaxID=413964 RepID=A0AAW9S5Q1_9BACT
MINYKPLVYFVALLLCMYAQTSQLQGQKEDMLFKLKGEVLDSLTQRPVCAKIVFRNYPKKDLIGVFKNNCPDGNYQMNLLQATVYSLEVTAEGYWPLFEELHYKDSEGFSKDFYLTPIEYGEVMRLDNVRFMRNEAAIMENSYRELNKILTLLLSNPLLVVQLEGHTEVSHNHRYNLKLSKDRVQSIRDYLVNYGVKRSQIKTKAYGETQPLIDGNSLEADRQNRRVEMRILEI